MHAHWLIEISAFECSRLQCQAKFIENCHKSIHTFDECSYKAHQFQHDKLF